VSDPGDKRFPDGSIIGSDDDWTPEHYTDSMLYFPVMGVVLRVYPSDHENNKSARDDALLRGHYWEADIAVVLDRSEGQTELSNVVIAPTGPSGLDNFSQDLPRPSSFMIDGTEFKGSTEGVDFAKLDGDRCLVQFIGGKLTQPVMTSWYPHPANNRDPSTSGTSPNSLTQGRPHLYRRNGTSVSVTGEGSVFVDTNEAASTLSGSPSGYRRTPVGYGGDVQVDMKPTASFEVNFNDRVYLPDTEPSVLQPNPPLSDTAPTDRSIDQTSLFMDSNSIIATAGSIIRLLTTDSSIYLTPGTGLYFGDQGSSENMVLGQVWKTSMTTLLESVISFMEEFNKHTHATGTGPSSVPLAPEVTTVTQIIPEVQELIDNIDDNLSDYIYGSKDVPDSVELDLYAREEETGEGE
jgi:hypothetical protein